MSRVTPFRFGVYHKRGIESTFMVTPVFRYHRDAIIEFHDTERGRVLADIFTGMGHIRFVKDPITIEEAFARYGNPKAQDHCAHICKMHVDAMAMGHNNYIPWMVFSPADILFAKRFLAQFRNPIVICPVAGAAVQNPGGEGYGRMMPMASWQRIVDALRDEHDFVYFTKEDNHIPLKHTHPVLNLSLRQMCAVFKVAQIYLGIENGLHHGAIAAGAHTRCFINLNLRQFFAPNTFYTDDMWWDEPKRVQYYSYSGVDGLITDISLKPRPLEQLETNLLTHGPQAM